MRAKEFITEYKKYPTTEYGGVTFTMVEKDGELTVKALNDFGIEMGHVIFNMDGKELDPQELEVEEKYQRQGVASTMYDYIKSRGFIINRSWDQSDQGSDFWDKHRGEDVRVWEEGVAEDENNTFSSEQVLNYIKSIHMDGWLPAADNMITRHKTWTLKQVPISSLQIPDPDIDDFNDPYGRVHDTDLHHVDRIVQQIATIIQKKPIVIDPKGHILDGNHRALAALKAGLKTIPAYIPT
jgi:hypothetical protein